MDFVKSRRLAIVAWTVQIILGTTVMILGVLIQEHDRLMIVEGHMAQTVMVALSRSFVGGVAGMGGVVYMLFFTLCGPLILLTAVIGLWHNWTLSKPGNITVLDDERRRRKQPAV